MKFPPYSCTVLYIRLSFSVSTVVTGKEYTVRYCKSKMCAHRRINDGLSLVKCVFQENWRLKYFHLLKYIVDMIFWAIKDWSKTDIDVLHLTLEPAVPHLMTFLQLIILTRIRNIRKWRPNSRTFFQRTLRGLCSIHYFGFIS